MNNLKKKLIRKARKEYKRIYPCGNKESLMECFTTIEDKIVFWFNTDDNSTHLLTHTTISDVRS